MILKIAYHERQINARLTTRFDIYIYIKSGACRKILGVSFFKYSKWGQRNIVGKLSEPPNF